jgi:putative redox protein
MNPGMTIEYLGSLRCEARHVRSGNVLITDAPPDNHGKGEAFSPTDLMCTSLACCMLSIMGIAAEEKDISFHTASVAVEKVMDSNPRRVVEIRLAFTLEGGTLDAREKAILEHAALTCPVAKSLHPDLRQTVQFQYR